MTGPALAAERLHDLTVLDVGDLTFTVAPPSARCTLEVIVDRDASLIVLGPSTATVEQVQAFEASVDLPTPRGEGRAHGTADREAIR